MSEVVINDEQTLNAALINTKKFAEVAPRDLPGRPSKYTPATVSLLLVAFNNGYNVEEACAYAGIAKQTYYDWEKHKTGFLDAMTRAKQMPNRKAKENILGAMAEGDVNASKWWLERRDPEFKSKTELSPSPELSETRNKIREFLDEPDDPREDDGSAQLAQPADSSAEAEQVAESAEHLQE